MAALGATWNGEDTRFALFSRHASAVELCLFERPGSAVEYRRVPLVREADSVWSVRLADAGPGTLYGYRVHGPYSPEHGHRFSPAKLLVDPHARAITGEPRGDDPACFATTDADSAAAMPKCMVVDSTFAWDGDAPPRTPWRDTVIYECHVKGMTKLHPAVPEPLRGTYLGLVEPPVLEHLLGLGVTAVQLLPVSQIASESQLLSQGLRNYWGYSPLGFFAPHAGYATGGLGEQVTEFKTMVRELHRHGIEVILDVVYNHTPEGDQLGPTLSLRGIDNHSYYRLDPHNPACYVDFTGCRNTLDVRCSAVRRLILDSLRYWAEEVHVDGFRLDLAPTLGRDGEAFESQAAVFAAIEEDPRLSRVKVIAEPWDLGPDGYRLGGFPRRWAEWNDRYRDAVRRFWCGDAGAGAELEARFLGSYDLLGTANGGASRSINYVTAHDGFTLADLVSYEHKVNWENGEDNRDGTDHNLSRNWGCEGPTTDPSITAARRRARRNMLLTLVLAQGVPMLRHGDELGHGQKGNNNPYCQDSELSWLDWQGVDHEFLSFARRVSSLRRELSALRWESWRPEERAGGEGLCFAIFGEDPSAVPRGPRFLLVLNNSALRMVFRLPVGGPEGAWHQLVHTASSSGRATVGGQLELSGGSAVLLGAAGGGRDDSEGR